MTILFQIFIVLSSIFYVSCDGCIIKNIDNPEEEPIQVDGRFSKFSPQKPVLQKPGSQNNDIEYDIPDDKKEFAKPIFALLDCYDQSCRPDAKNGSKLCINELITNWERYAASVKIYVDEIPADVNYEKMILQRQPVNIEMNTSYHFDKWQKFLDTTEIKSLNPEKSFYTEYYNKNKKLAPNIALYCETPILDESDPQNLKTHDIGLLSVSGFGFDDPKQPDHKYFLSADGKSFQVGKEQEFEEKMKSVFEKIFVCATNKNYKNVYVDGFGCGAFGGSMIAAVIKIYNKLLTEYTAKLQNVGIKLINGYTDKPYLFEKSKNWKMNCFTEAWKNKFGPIEETLFVNNWDPHSLPGNGNNADPSVDGGYGRNAPIALIGYPGINKELLKKENQVVV